MAVVPRVAAPIRGPLATGPHRGEAAARRAAPLPGCRPGTRPGRKCWSRPTWPAALRRADLAARQRMSYSVGFPLPHDAAKRLVVIPKKVWAPASESDGEVRPGAWVAESTGLPDLSGCPTLTGTGSPRPPRTSRVGSGTFWSWRHRRRARAEDRIGSPRDTGLTNLPLHDFTQNQIWGALVALALDLTAWTPLLALISHPARRCEPKRLRLRLLSVADRLAVPGRRVTLHLSAHSHRTELLVSVVNRLRTLREPTPLTTKTAAPASPAPGTCKPAPPRATSGPLSYPQGTPPAVGPPKAVTPPGQPGQGSGLAIICQRCWPHSTRTGGRYDTALWPRPCFATCMGWSAGFVYVLTNPSMPGLIKVGESRHLAEDRARQLRTTGVPTPFMVSDRVLTSHPLRVERRAHELLATCRVDAKREFFAVPADEASRVVRQAAVEAGGAEAWQNDAGHVVRSGDRLALNTTAGSFFVLLPPHTPTGNWLLQGAPPPPIDIWQMPSDGDLLELAGVGTPGQVAGFSTEEEPGREDPVPSLTRAGDLRNAAIIGRERVTPRQRLLWLDPSRPGRPGWVDPCWMVLFDFDCYCQVVARSWAPKLSEEGVPVLLNTPTSEPTRTMMAVIRKVLQLPSPPLTVRPVPTDRDARFGSAPQPPEHWLPQLAPPLRKRPGKAAPPSTYGAPTTRRSKRIEPLGQRPPASPLARSQQPPSSSSTRSGVPHQLELPYDRADGEGEGAQDVESDGGPDA